MKRVPKYKFEAWMSKGSCLFPTSIVMRSKKPLSERLHLINFEGVHCSISFLPNRQTGQRNERSWNFLFRGTILNAIRLHPWDFSQSFYRTKITNESPGKFANDQRGNGPCGRRCRGRLANLDPHWGAHQETAPQTLYGIGGVQQTRRPFGQFSIAA